MPELNLTLCCIVTSLIASAVTIAPADKVVFSFPEFPYKETGKNEMAFHEYESACEQSPSCSQLASISRVRCVRECVSPSCYSEIYQSDQLEEGEIDVRLNSFKGCFVQRVHRQRP
ncbi:uncharacterized protein LOC117644427 isoform X1 [Thrips palmi]|uniref:Uncharacterized protein LOC117644427 isoform X1 n=1 Tax=Thrips palmi TaxID=161013 RepID=A0A6P8YR43_THRPL|nr:uncharacterized protein LOC117644427 isoform X1 [Thrips palmi]